MEGVVVDQSISACKQIKTRASPYSENLAPLSNIHGGLLHAPPPSLSFSYSPSASVFNLYRYHQQVVQAHQQRQQHPPLLPLPVPKPQHQSLPSRTRGLSRPPTAARSRSLTPKKPKSKPSKKDEAKQDINAISECFIIASTNRLGPDPNDLPKDVTKVIGKKSLVGSVDVGEMEKFSGSIFTLSPPPSSLPLPRFSLQPRLSCNAEAAATDNLRRLLRLP